MDDSSVSNWFAKTDRYNCYVTHPERQNDVLQSLKGEALFAFGDLIFHKLKSSKETRSTAGSASAAASDEGNAILDGAWFSQDCWYDCQVVEFKSVQDAAQKLHQIRPDWRSFPQKWHRRSELISKALDERKRSPFQPYAPLKKRLGTWTLISPNHLLFSISGSHPIAGGAPLFAEPIETKIQPLPPSKAYLKLWELFTTYGFKPGKDQVCLDMGACPGGWSWVLAQLGCQVISVDKAPLHDSITKFPNIQFLQEDAFRLKPHDLKTTVDWFFSDIICDPDKLFELTKKWQTETNIQNFVCTLKFKGETDFESVRKFAQLAKNSGSANAYRRSGLVHLHCNRHELTYFSIHRPSQS